MKKYTFLIICLAFCWSIEAQTKLISHKSHSGSKATFSTALENNLFDISHSNFGDPPNSWSWGLKLDSLKFLTDTSAIMACSHVNSAYEKQIDTIYHYPIFSLQHNLDSIKTVLDNHYFFENKMEETKFIDYDNDNSATQEKEDDGTYRSIYDFPEQYLKPPKRKQQPAPQPKQEEIQESTAPNSESQPTPKPQKEQQKEKEEVKPKSAVTIIPTSPPTPPKGPSPFLILSLACLAGILGWVTIYSKKFGLKPI